MLEIEAPITPTPKAGWPMCQAAVGASRRSLRGSLLSAVILGGIWSSTATAEPAAAPNARPASEAIPLDIRADNLVLNQKQGTARFTGHVVARQGDFELRCGLIKARYDDEGVLQTIDAEGEVTVKGEGLKAMARQATYRHEEGVLTLTGEPRLERAGAWLTGARIRYWPEGGKVQIEQARGQFKAPPLARTLKKRASR
ncbi:MAG: LptA/OstA family protein [Bradymonadia bacterium]